MAHLTASAGKLSNRWCRRRWGASAIWILLAMVALPASAQDSDIPLAYAMTSEDRLAQQLNNPLANLITVPVQNNFDFGGWRDGEGFRYTLVAQPVLPFKPNNEWNRIQARRSGELGFPVAHDIRVSSTMH